jgi:hypothetical protein
MTLLKHIPCIINCLFVLRVRFMLSLHTPGLESWMWPPEYFYEPGLLICSSVEGWGLEL